MEDHREIPTDAPVQQTVVSARWYADEECWVFDDNHDPEDHDPSDHLFVTAVPADLWARRAAAWAELSATYDELVSEFGLALSGPWYDAPCPAFVEGRSYDPAFDIPPELVAMVRRQQWCKTCGRPRVYHAGEDDAR